MHFLHVLLVLLFATLLAVFIAGDDFKTGVLRYVDGATYSRNDLEYGCTGLGLAVGGLCFFVGAASAAVLVNLALRDTTI